MSHPEVNTKCGRLRGLTETSVDGLKFFSFRGIPYAKPPVGELRFEDPVPAEPWTDIKDVFNFGSMAAQFDLCLNLIDGEDDCLYLNVYTNSIEPNTRRPVMVWIHGGAFLYGSGNDALYGPDFLIKKDIILVTINYRLGVLGFLNLEDEIAPGNQGLKDQVMALQWVHNNIANFGGDPDNITIFGESAGAASVHYLTMSPLAKGLFHRAISQSGVATCAWASVSKNPRQSAYKLCARLGKEITDHKEIIKFLRTIEALKLIEVQSKMFLEEANKIGIPFGPGVDLKSSNPFLLGPVENISRQGAHVPYLIGHTDREGTFIMKMVKMENFESIDEQFEKFLSPAALDMLKINNLAPDDLKYIYFRNEKISKANSDKVIDLIGDLLFVQDIHNIVRIQAEHNSAPTYMYQFTYDKGYCFSKLMYEADTSGASHMDDLAYLFNMKFYETLKVDPPKRGTYTYTVMEQMVEMWTNFAKTGRPTPVITDNVPVYWEPVTSGTILRYMNIGENLRMEKMLNINEKFVY